MPSPTMTDSGSGTDRQRRRSCSEAANRASMVRSQSRGWVVSASVEMMIAPGAVSTCAAGPRKRPARASVTTRTP